MEKESKTDREAEFVRLLTANHEGLLRFARTLVPNRSDAEDVYQRASVSLWKKHEEYDPEQSFFPWACRFVHYEVLNYRKRKSRDRLTFSDDVVELLVEDHIEDQPELEQRRKALDLCIEKLSASDRQVLQTRYSESGSIAELAKGLARTPKQLYKTLERLRRNLAVCVDKATGGSI